MIPLDGLLKTTAALVCGAFGLMVLLGQPRRPAGRFLALFLGLIALNQGMEALRAFSPDADVRTMAFRVATVAAALDPVALLAFASFARGAPTRRTYVELGAVLAFSATIVGWAALVPIPGRETVVDFLFMALLTGGTVAVYTVTLLRELRVPRERRDAAWRSLVPALAVVTLPTWGTAADEVSRLARLLHGSWPRFSSAATLEEVAYAGVGFAACVALGGAALLAWRARRGMADDPAGRRAVLLGVALAVSVTLLIRAADLLYLVSQAGVDLRAAWTPIGRAGAAFRWLAFGAFASVAALRFHGVEMTLAARRRSARVLILVALATSAVAVAAFAGTLLGGLVLRPFDLVLLGLLVGASQGARRLVDGVARRVYGLPAPYDGPAGREIYARAAAQAASEGRILSRDPHLQRLREELGLDAATAGLLERLAEERAGGPLAPGQLVQGRYHVLRLLGAGASGQAFLARDETLGRDVVLKAVPAEGPQAEDAAREARIAGSVSHPNVVTVHDVLARPGVAVLVLEHAAGGSLDGRVAREGKLSPEDGLRVLVDVLQGLEAVHARGIVHRDVKPGNLFLSAQGGAKVGDFGVARLHEGRTVHAAEGRLVVGSPAFMAPEQRRGEEATARSDLYSLALVAKATIDVPDDPAWRRLLERALREDPRERWGSASEMLAEARALAGAAAQRR